MTRQPDVLGQAHRRLAAAETIEDLLEQVEAFLRGLPRARIEEMTPDCRPRRIHTQKDVSHWSQRLDRYRMLGAEGTRTRGFCMVHDFFAHAQAHAQQLRSRRELQPPVVMPRRVEPPGPRPFFRRLF
jgi:hypothetical protein